MAIEVGSTLPTVGQLPDPRMQFACNPHLSGHGGGHDTNLRRMAADGIRLVGRFDRRRWRARHVRARPGGQPPVRGRVLRRALPADHRHVHRADRNRRAGRRPRLAGLRAARGDRARPRRGPASRPCSGRPAIPPTTAGCVCPSSTTSACRASRGVTDVPGLTFIGLLWQHTIASANLVGWPRELAAVASAAYRRSSTLPSSDRRRLDGCGRDLAAGLRVEPVRASRA